ncbi:MAG: hypothetical protein ACYTFG_02005 [Planctomycetota bacterium]|jgi:hypothetical protein
MTEGPGRPADSTQGPQDREHPSTLSRLEKTCFLILGNRDLSFRIARETMEAHGEGDEARQVREGLTRSIREAESRGMEGDEFSVLPRDGEGGLIGPEDGLELRRIFKALSPHSRGLLLSHFSYRFDPAETADILGINVHSVPVNVVSLLGKLRNAVGTGDLPPGCGGPEEEIVDLHGLGVTAQEDVSGADEHLARCETCSARFRALRKESTDLSAMLEPLREADRSEASLVEAATLMDREGDSVPLNVSKVLNMSKASCMGLMAMIGIGGAVLITAVTLTPQERKDFWGLLMGAPPAPVAPVQRPPPSTGPHRRTPPPLSIAEALNGLSDEDDSVRKKAESVLLELGRRKPAELLERRRTHPAHRKALDDVILRLGREKNRRMEADAQNSKRNLRGEALRMARQEMDRLPERLKELRLEIDAADEELGSLKSRGAGPREIRESEYRLNSLKLERGDLEGMTLEHMAAKIHLAMQALANARVRRCLTRRMILTTRASVGLLLGASPAFPWRKALEAQKSLKVPNPCPTPSPLLGAALDLAKHVDFPLTLDPALGAESLGASVAISGDTPRVDAILAKMAEAARGRWVEFHGALFLTAADELPRDLLEHLASHLALAPAESRHAAAWGFETMTWKSFSFHAEWPEGRERNDSARKEMHEWFLKNRSSIHQDPETGRYGAPGEAHGD